MPYALGDYVHFYKLPAGRAAFALKQIAELAPGLDVPRVVEAVQVALHQALTLEAQELGPDPRSTLFTPEASELDAQIDRLLAAIAQTLEAHIRSGSELAALATTTHDTLFPRGVAPLTRQPFIEEHESVTQLLVTLDTRARRRDLGP